MKLIRHYIAYVLLVFSGLLTAQEAYEEFGQYRVQYENHDWKYIASKNFNIYYYEGGAEVAHNAARYAETEYTRMTDMLGYIPRKRLTLVVYNSFADLNSSNIGLGSPHYLGGETNFVKSTIEIGFPGTQEEFRKEIVYRISKVLLNIMMYGGNLKDVVQSNYMLNLPPWFIDGAARYLAEPYSATTNNYVQAHLRNTKKIEPSHASGIPASYIGQSIWHFLVERYGMREFTNVINLTRITRNERSSITSTTRVPYDAFLNEWAEFYLQDSKGYAIQEQTRIAPFYSAKYIVKDIKIDPSGEFVAITRSFEDRQDLIILNKEGKRIEHRIIHYFKAIDQKAFSQYPVVQWKSPTEIAYITYKKGQPTFTLLNIETKKKYTKVFSHFDDILDMDFCPVNVDEVVFSGVNKGQVDIYTYSFRLNKADRITKDIYDDVSPRYIPGTEDIVFCSNRLSDTLLGDAGTFETLNNNKDVFVIRKGNMILDRITQSAESEEEVFWENGNQLYFIVEGKKRKSLYSYKIQNRVAYKLPVASFQDLSIRGGICVSSSGTKGNKINLFAKPELVHDHAYFIKPMIGTVENDNDTTIEGAYEFLLGLNLDHLRFDSKHDKYHSPSDSTPLDAELLRLLRESEDLDVVKTFGPYSYQRQAGLDNFVTSLMGDQNPVRTLGLLMHANLSEMLGDHRFSASYFLPNDLQSYRMKLNYAYLKRRIDYKAQFRRDELNVQSEKSARYAYNLISGRAIYPFNPVSATYLEVGLQNTSVSDLNFATTSPEKFNYFHFKTGLKFDNTSSYGQNMILGTRAKASFRQEYNPKDHQRSFHQVEMEVRHYHKILKEITLAVRVSAGHYGGNSPKYYLLGGMDNWLIPVTDNLGSAPLDFGEQTEQLLFVDYVTPLRGFRYNAQNGHNHVLFNGEFRVPIAHLLMRKPVQSKFFKNLQLTAFYDVGAAWDSGNIFTKNNSNSTITIKEDPIEATVTSYTSPFIAGYGFGFRTMMLGYYTKIDLAWGIKDYEVQFPKLYLTVGYDF